MYESNLGQGTFSIASFGILEKQDEPSEGGIFANEIMLRKLIQLSNALLPIEPTAPGMVIEVKLLQFLNNSFPIMVIELERLMESKLVQPLKAAVPILVTEFGIYIKL